MFVAVSTTSRFRRSNTRIKTSSSALVRQHQSSPRSLPVRTCTSKKRQHSGFMVVLCRYIRIYETYNFAMFSLRHVTWLSTVITRLLILFTSLVYRPNTIDLSLFCSTENQFQSQIPNKKTWSVDIKKLRRCFAAATSRHGRGETKGFHTSLTPTTGLLKHSVAILNGVIQIYRVFNSRV